MKKKIIILIILSLLALSSCDLINNHNYQKNKVDKNIVNSSNSLINNLKLDEKVQSECWESAVKFIDDENKRQNSKQLNRSAQYSITYSYYNLDKNTCYAYSKVFEKDMQNNGNPYPTYIYTIWDVTQEKFVDNIMHHINDDSWDSFTNEFNKNEWDQELQQIFGRIIN